MFQQESMIQAALENLESDKPLSVRVTPKMCDLCESTIKRPQQVRSCEKNPHEAYQRLSKLQEEYLVQ